MATTPVLLPGKIPWTEEPGRLQSMGSRKVGHDWATSLSLFTFMYWRRKWQPTPVFLPGESQGRQSLVGYHLWGRTESVGHYWSNLAAAAAARQSLDSTWLSALLLISPSFMFRVFPCKHSLNIVSWAKTTILTR